MGRAMASHVIKAGYDTTVFSRTEEKCKPLQEMGATLVSTPAEVAERSDVVFLIVGYPEDVRSCVLGEDGVLSGMKSGGVVVDMTTSDPELAIEIYKKSKEIEVASIDAPVSGGDVGAKNGALTIMMGGDAKAVKAVEPVLQTFGKTMEHMGGPGSGQHTKMANQIMISTTMLGLIEGMMYAKKAGLDVSQMINAVRGGAAGSRSLELYAERIVKRDFEPGFFVDHFVKDMGICAKEAERMDLGLPGLALAKKCYEIVQEEGYGLKGTQALMVGFERKISELSRKEKLN